MKIYTWGIEEKHVNNQENEIEIYNLFLSIFLIIHYLSDHFLFVSLSLSLSLSLLSLVEITCILPKG